MGEHAAPPKVLLTGGSGRLGRELASLLPGVVAPTRSEMDITRPGAVGRTLDAVAPDVVVHAAAFTDVAGAERQKDACWRVNVHGTRVVAAAAHDRRLRFVHISTDYVFDGERGRYREDEPPGRPTNYYALSKIVAEELARVVDRHLVIRTSFRPREWLHPVAFTDLWTSQDYVDVIAPLIALVIRNVDRLDVPTLHVGTDRKTAFELARRRRPDVRPGLRADAGVELPRDVSLDLGLWERIAPSLTR